MKSFVCGLKPTILFLALTFFYNNVLISENNYHLNENNSVIKQYCGKCFLIDNKDSSNIIQNLPTMVENLYYWNLFLIPQKSNLCNSLNEYAKENSLSSLLLCENANMNFASNNFISFKNSNLFNLDVIDSINLIEDWFVKLDKNKENKAHYLISCSNFNFDYLSNKPNEDNKVCVFLKDKVEYETIIQALLNGLSYVTFSPLLTFSINNAFPGETHIAEDFIKIQFSVFFDSEEAFDNFKKSFGNWIRVEILKDSKIIRTFPIKLTSLSFSREFDFFDLNLKGFYILKVVSNDGKKLIALTNPIFVK